MREIDAHIIDRFLAGNASLQEEKEVEEWYRSFKDQGSLTPGFTQTEFEQTSAKMWDHICQSVSDSTASSLQNS